MYNLYNSLIHAFPENEVPNDVEFADYTSDPQCKLTLDDLSCRELCLPSLPSSCQRNYILKCIDNFLLEDDDSERAFMGKDSSSLQETDRSLYNLVNEKHPHFYQDQLQTSRPCDLHKNCIRRSISNGIGKVDKPSCSRSSSDKVLLCPCLEPSSNCVLLAGLLDKKASSTYKTKVLLYKKPGELLGKERETVDLMTLLAQCAQAMVKNDISSANKLLWQVKQHSSPLGDGIERMAYYAAKLLEPRIAGTGIILDVSHLLRRLSSADILKAYLAFLSTCPFTRMSDFLANNCILKLVEITPTIYMTDFGMSNGYQCPRLIQYLTTRYGRPPFICITGLDIPQPAFSPHKGWMGLEVSLTSLPQIHHPRHKSRKKAFANIRNQQ